MPFGRRPTGLILLLLTLEWSGASAETTVSAETVILLQPTGASPAVRRSLARIRDELSADRFHVVLADSNTAGDAGAVIESATSDADAGTMLALFGDPEAGQAELCVVRRSVRRTAVRRAMVLVDDPERMPEALATRALELLRATALELSIETERAQRSQRPPEPRLEADIPAKLAPPAAAPEIPIVVAAMGVGVWTSIEGPPPAVTPVARIGLRLSDWAWARVSVAGLGSHPRVENAYGSATLSQSVALAELAAVFRHDKRIRLMSSLGVGALNVAVAGTGAAPYEDREPQQWSAAVDGGVGMALAIGTRAALVTELHALLASPHPVVRFVDTRAATIGYPSLILTLALQVAL
jgi:hypothetical protein